MSTVFSVDVVVGDTLVASETVTGLGRAKARAVEILYREHDMCTTATDWRRGTDSVWRLRPRGEDALAAVTPTRRLIPHQRAGFETETRR